MRLFHDRRMRPVLFVLLGLTCKHELFTSNAVGQELRGTVIQRDTNLPLPSVNVILKNTKYGATTDSLGRFEIKNFPVGAYVLVVRRLGYRSNTYILTAERDEPIELTVELELEPILMEEVQVIDDAERAKLLRSQGKTIITSDQIKHTGTKSLAILLRSYYPGLFPVYVRSNERLHFVLYINGTLVRYTPDVFDTMIDVEEVDYIEVYRSFGETPTMDRGSNERVVHIHTKKPELRR